MSQTSPTPVMEGTGWRAVVLPDAPTITTHPTNAADLHDLIDFAVQPANWHDKLKDDARSTVVRLDFAGQTWVVKQTHAPPGRRWLHRLYSIFHLSPASREIGGAALLTDAGLRVNVPRAQIFLGDRSELLLFPFIPGPTLDRFLAGAPSVNQWTMQYRRQRLQLAAAIGNQIGRIAATGLTNRDHKPTNLIIDPVCRHDGAEPLIIDTSAIRQRTRDLHVLNMIAVMWRSAARVGPTTSRERFACVKAAVEADPSLMKKRGDTRRRARAVARRTTQLHNARPLSYDPTDAPAAQRRP